MGTQEMQWYKGSLFSTVLFNTIMRDSGIKGSMSKVAKSFICIGCLNPVTSAGRTSVDIGASAKLELVYKFCYLGDMLCILVGEFSVKNSYYK